MESVFLTLINMSLTASWLVLASLVVRLLIKRAPKWIMVVMWAFVAVRLICPFSPESAFSLIPSSEAVSIESIYSDTTAPSLVVTDPAVNAAPSPQAIDPKQTALSAMMVVWIAGMIAMSGYAMIGTVRIRRKVREAVPLENRVWLCDHINTPFILGVIRPRIFLPSAMSETDAAYVIAHERAHLSRGDHLWKPLGYGLLTVYCFNPAMWIAYVLLCKDIELACDEKVMRTLGERAKKPYADALINCSVPRRWIAACPLAFGEVSVKERVKAVLAFKKPTVWILIAAIAVCSVTAVCFLTNPKETPPAENTPVNVALTTTTIAPTTQTTTLFTTTTISTAVPSTTVSSTTAVPTTVTASRTTVITTTMTSATTTTVTTTTGAPTEYVLIMDKSIFEESNKEMEEQLNSYLETAIAGRRFYEKYGPFLGGNGDSSDGNEDSDPTPHVTFPTTPDPLGDLFGNP